MRDQVLDDYFDQRIPSTISRNQKTGYIAYRTSAVTHEKGKKTDCSIVILDANLSRKKVIHENNADLFSHEISPDGRRIAFFEKSDLRTLLSVRSIDGDSREDILISGEPHLLKWVNDTDILLLATEPESQELKAEKEKGNDGFYFEEASLYRSLYLYSPGSGFKKLTSNLQVWDFDIAMDRVALIASAQDNEASWYSSRLYTFEIGKNSPSEMYDPGFRQIGRPRVSPDGMKISFLESIMSDFGGFSGDVLVTDIVSGKTENATPESDRSYQETGWLDPSTLFVVWTKECVGGISKITDSRMVEIWSSPGTILPSFCPSISKMESGFIFPFQDGSNPAEVCILDNALNLRRISKENSKLLETEAPSQEVVRWKSEDSQECYGIFRSAGKDKPVVVFVHGGPTSYSQLTFISNTSYLVRSGFSVFLPNYRGSIGKGRKYAEANRGDMGGMDLQDILTGMDFLKESGHTDTDKWFITGGSYGGFITSLAVTRTNRFNAAVGLFGISDWVSFHGTTKIADWDPIHYDQSPYAHDIHEKYSALNFIDKIRTPVLLMHGIEDPYVPVGQYLQFYRALKDQGKEVRLLLFPREGHGFSETPHVRQWMLEALEWFRKFS